MGTKNNHAIIMIGDPERVMEARAATSCWEALLRRFLQVSCWIPWRIRVYAMIMACHLPSICPKCGSYGNWEWLNVTNRAFIMKPWAMGIEYRMGVHQLYQTLELQSGLYSQFPQFPYPNDSISWTISMLMVLKFQSHSTLAESMLLGRMVTRILTHGSWMWPEISE